MAIRTVGGVLPNRMYLRSPVWWAVPALVAALTLLGGCATGRLLRQGRQAERAGRAHVAYDYYCQAAERRPSNGGIAAKMARVAPAAARYWADRARAAERAGDYDTAWKLLMRSLSIRPDRETVARSIRRLQRAHPEATAEARRAYLVQGPSVLAKVQPPSPSRREEDRPPIEVVARADSTTPIPHDAEAEPPPAEAAPKPPATADEPRRPTPRPTVSHDGDKPRRPFLFTGTISREDRRYPRKSPSVDGIFIKVLDTDPEPDADMELYVGRRRVAKLKDWQPGWRARVKGRSGRYYEIVITKIEDRRETVHFGVRPTR
ncbi:MAG: hypothetical protein GY778_24935 [bacterium]|nr:hypothetical protein [bacterium]